MLAFYFALSHVASEFSEGYLPPLVLDSPHDKAQDEINRPMVTKFIFDHKVHAQQLIVALEDPPPDDVVLEGPDDSRIDLDEKYGVLKTQQYSEVLNRVEPLVRMAVTNLGTELF